jgi:putative addiction module component (TIGR02574 family)
MNKPLLQELLKLSPAERIELVNVLWESLSPADVPPLTAEQEAELDRRWAEHERDPSSAIPWDDVLSWLRSRRR